MSDWQKGDLALCVKDTQYKEALAGRIYTVEGVEIAPPGWADAGSLGIYLLEAKAKHSGSTAFLATRFVKVTPPKDMKLEPLEIEVSA